MTHTLHRPSRLLIPLAAALAGALVATPARPQEGSAEGHAAAPVAHAARAQGRIVLDGRLDEGAWEAATPVTSFTQLDPDEGRPASERTEVRILFDDDALYVGARLYDRGPVSRRLVRRDAVALDADWLTVALDSYHNHLTSFRFSVNPSGVRRDEIFSSASGQGGGGGGGSGRGGGGGGGGGTAALGDRGGVADPVWDPVWSAATAVTDSGWVAEMRIPFGQLRFSRAEVQTWGIQLERRIARKQEHSLFAFTPKSEQAGVGRFGHLEGVRTVRAQRPLEILPYASGRAFYRPTVAQNPAAGFANPFQSRSELGGGVGADLKYRVTSNLTLDATINPDFGQVELDPAVVNLTAFETRFDEKRPFFVEGAEILRFGTAVQGNPEGGPPQLLYSRRIGRAPQLGLPAGAVYADLPQTTTILGAAKLTGRTAGGWSIGLLEAVTASERGSFVRAGGERGTAVVEPLANYLAARLRRDVRGGRSSLGGIVTAVNRRLDEPGAVARLRSAAYAGGVDFRHESDDRVWSVFGSLSTSHIRGSASAITAAQRASARYFQRPDAGHVELDPTATSLSGYRAQVDAGKRAGTWIWNVALTATSPGYEINDAGFQLNADRIMVDPNLTYEQNRPGPLFRRWSLRVGPDFDFNYDGDLIRQINMASFQSQLHNFWTGTARFSYSTPVMSDRLTRGGPLARLPGGWSGGVGFESDPRRRYSVSGGANYADNQLGLDQVSANLSLGFKPTGSWEVQVGPNLSRVRSPAQYVTTVSDAAATRTYGSRYVFADLDQTTLGIDTRLNVTFSPSLTLELYAQPFLSSNDFGALKELSAPRTYDFVVYGRDAGTVTRERGARSLVDPDGSGPARAFRVTDRDFNLNSLRGNAVFRWEWRPGSTLFLVWQQDRADRLSALDAELQGRELGSFDAGRNVQDLLDARPTNVLLFKVSYWLNP